MFQPAQLIIDDSIGGMAVFIVHCIAAHPSAAHANAGLQAQVLILSICWLRCPCMETDVSLDLHACHKP
jgi:hypothetical protein